MNKATAAEVEAALIDAYPGLTNIAPGDGSGDFGVMHAAEIIRRYGADAAELKHKILFININRTSDDSELYEATRFAWKLAPAKARQAEFICAVKQGLIVETFIADEWLPATQANFPHRKTIQDRWAFNGRIVPDDIRTLYVGKRTPERFRKKQAANPIRYGWEAEVKRCPRGPHPSSGSPSGASPRASSQSRHSLPSTASSSASPPAR